MAYSKVERRTWNDERFRRWPKDRRDVWLYLLTTPHLDQPGGRFGCCVLDPMYAAADLSAPDDRWTPERVEAQLTELEREGRIVWDSDARLVLLVRFFDHNRPENPNVVTAMTREIGEVPYSTQIMATLLTTVRERLPERFEKGQPLGAAIANAITARLEREARETGTPVRQPSTLTPTNPLSGTGINHSERVATTVPKGSPQPFANHEHEQEHEHKQVKNTEDKSSEAGPRADEIIEEDVAGDDEDGIVPPPPPGCKQAERDAEDFKEARGVLAPLIRKHLWLGKDAPRIADVSMRGWSMGRELNIATGFLKRGEATVEELSGAIEYARLALGFSAFQPLTMLIFNRKGRRDALNESIALWRREESKRKLGRPKRVGEAVDDLLATIGGGSDALN